MSFPDFPKININGTELTTAQVMVIHTAIQSFAMECQKKNPPSGRKLAKIQLERIAEINKIMIP